jgi:hypothetical protein
VLGTAVVILVAVFAEITPATKAVLGDGPVNSTCVTAVRSVPVIATAAPAAPEAGEKPVKAGVATVGTTGDGLATLPVNVPVPPAPSFQVPLKIFVLMFKVPVHGTLPAVPENP